MARPQRFDRDASERLLQQGCILVLLKLVVGIGAAILAILNYEFGWF